MPVVPPADLSLKRVRTRTRLIDAAAEVFGERGFHTATLADVAHRAGMTTGAIYGNFKSKEELFLAIFEAPVAGVAVQFREGASAKEQMHLVGEAVLAFLPVAKARGVLFAEFQTYVQTHPDMQAEVERRTAANAARIAPIWRDHIPEAEICMPMEQFVVVVDAMMDGLIGQWLRTPKVVTEAIIIAAFEALA